MSILTIVAVLASTFALLAPQQIESNPHPISPTNHQVKVYSPFWMAWSESENAVRYQVNIKGGFQPGTINWTSGPIRKTGINIPGFPLDSGAAYKWKVRKCLDVECTTYGPWSEPYTFYWEYIPGCVPTQLLPTDGSVIYEEPFRVGWVNCVPDYIPGGIEDEGDATHYNLVVSGPGVNYDVYIHDAPWEYFDKWDGFQQGEDYTWRVRTCWMQDAGGFICGDWTPYWNFTYNVATITLY